MRRFSGVVLFCFLALSTSALASESAQQKRAVIATALRRLEHHMERMDERTRSRNPSGGFFRFRTPNGISRKEWTHAVLGDERLWLLSDGKSAPEDARQQQRGWLTVAIKQDHGEEGAGPPTKVTGWVHIVGNGKTKVFEVPATGLKISLPEGEYRVFPTSTEAESEEWCARNIWIHPGATAHANLYLGCELK